MNCFVSRTSPSLSHGSSILRQLRAGEIFFDENSGAGGGTGGSGGEAGGGASGSNGGGGSGQGGGQAGGAQNNGGQGGAGTGSGALSADAIAAAFNRELQNRGGAENLSRFLYTDNYELREQNRRLAEQVERAKLPNGAVVLTGDNLRAWNEFQSLGTVADVKTRLEQASRDSAYRQQIERSQQLEAAAKLEGWKPGLLKVLGRDLQVTIEETEVPSEEGNGQFVKVKRPFVVTKDAQGTEQKQPLREHFQALGEDVVASLQDQGTAATSAGAGSYSGSGTSSGTSSGTAAGQQQAAAIPFPAQGAGGKPQELDFAASLMESQFGFDKSGKTVQK